MSNHAAAEKCYEVLTVGQPVRTVRVPPGQRIDEHLTQNIFGDPDVSFQMIPAGSHALWCDESGALKNLPLNDEAMRRFGQYVHGGRLYGTVVWAPFEEDDESEDDY